MSPILRLGAARPLLALAFFTAFSCSHRSTGGPQTDLADDKQPMPDTIVVVEDPHPYLIAAIHKSTCFGSCPAFDATVYSDGYVHWCGEANTARIGNYQAYAPSAWMLDLLLSAERNGFFQMEPRYPLSGRLLPDVPITVCYFKHGKKERRIVDNADAPLPLQELEQNFIRKLEELEWTKME